MVPVDGIHLLRTVIAHRDYVRLAIQRITQQLETRALEHDLSKLGTDEFACLTTAGRTRLSQRGSPQSSRSSGPSAPTSCQARNSE